jgi:hypothetical protein
MIILKSKAPWTEVNKAVPKHEAIRSNGLSYEKQKALRIRF